MIHVSTLYQLIEYVHVHASLLSQSAFYANSTVSWGEDPMFPTPV